VTTEAETTSSAGSNINSEASPWPVAELSRQLKEYVERLTPIWVEGELASIQDSKGNLFAELRDLKLEFSVQLHAWASDRSGIDPTLQQGERVVALLQPQFWGKSGKLSMRIAAMRRVGMGELLERIARLRAQLELEGLTAPERKRALPLLPNRVGLITGANSDAEKDVLRIARDRWPAVEFETIHTLVQGDSAAMEISFALKQLDADPRVDVIIIARGGGSFQHLLPFSDEQLVRDAAAATTPIVSAIGHENDRPVLDDVADVRASTPTDAAKRVVPEVSLERAQLADLLARSSKVLRSSVSSELDLLEQLRSRPVLASPFGYLDNLGEKLAVLQQRVREIVQFRFEREQTILEQLFRRGYNLAPESVLERGYALLQDELGRILVGDPSPGTDLLIRRSRSEITATVKTLKKRS
jgi:exodeoxyribonuclease VII large subunit